MDRLWFATTKNDKSKNKHLFAGDRSIDQRVDPLQPVESSAAKVTSPLQIFTDLADCLIPAIGQPFHSWNTCLSGNQTMRILKFYFQQSLNDHEWVMTKFSSFLILKEMNNETSPRPEGGSEGKSWVVRMVERTKSQCHFCQPQNFTVRSLISIG